MVATVTRKNGILQPKPENARHGLISLKCIRRSCKITLSLPFKQKFCLFSRICQDFTKRIDRSIHTLGFLASHMYTGTLKFEKKDSNVTLMQ